MSKTNSTNTEQKTAEQLAQEEASRQAQQGAGQPEDKDDAADVNSEADEDAELTDEEKRVELNELADELGLLVVETGTLDQEQLEFVLGKLTEDTGAMITVVYPEAELTTEQKDDLIAKYAEQLGVDLAVWKAEEVAAGVEAALAKVDANTGGSGEKALIKIEEIKSIFQRTAANPRASAQLVKALLGIE